MISHESIFPIRKLSGILQKSHFFCNFTVFEFYRIDTSVLTWDKTGLIETSTALSNFVRLVLRYERHRKLLYANTSFRQTIFRIQFFHLPRYNITDIKNRGPTYICPPCLNSNSKNCFKKSLLSFLANQNGRSTKRICKWINNIFKLNLLSFFYNS